MTALNAIPFTLIDGKAATLKDFAGKVLLVVNVASKCGLTPQYQGLQKLYASYRDKGFEIIGFPANNFLGQEPGSEQEIAQFCTGQYGVTFPMAAKVSVQGDDIHPLFAAMIAEQPQATGNVDSQLKTRLTEMGLLHHDARQIMWNFEKFLIDGHGQVVGRFRPDITPDDPRVLSMLDSLLGL
ncbi:glutathione peroxidase [Gallaecimonas pentaromativorans]|uniref:Glutathione peroxidase n=1 Tax=Gallaecimonas pentaromativorans TaxID=584787 RepID=A0A3N1NWK8_9GAMM|nr:glutathione peroxidase [Gallaecimonas pentaromativorans]MED5525252.1 glutathione peroxidase [Pseudomonadota bacterium]ROQ24214.1 glutathione peroxidase [Gallaecimonas pentaromativorans]